MRETDDQASGGGTHLSAELQQPFPQDGDLRARAGRVLRVTAECLHEDVGGGREQHPELVGQEPRATRPVDLQAVLELLDAVLDVSTLAVDPLIDRSRGAVAQVGDHEARVVLGIPPRMPDDLGLDDDSTRG